MCYSTKSEASKTSDENKGDFWTEYPPKTIESELFTNLEQRDPNAFHIPASTYKEKYAQLLDLKEESKWTKSTTKNEVDIYTYSGEGNATGIMGISKFAYNYKVIMAALQEPEISFKANPFGEKLDILEKSQDGANILYMKFKGMFLVSGRDFVVWNKVVPIIDKNGTGMLSLDSRMSEMYIFVTKTLS